MNPKRLQEDKAYRPEINGMCVKYWGFNRAPTFSAGRNFRPWLANRLQPGWPERVSPHSMSQFKKFWPRAFRPKACSTSVLSSPKEAREDAAGRLRKECISSARSAAALLSGILWALAAKYCPQTVTVVARVAKPQFRPDFSLRPCDN